MNDLENATPEYCSEMNLATSRDVVGRDSSRHACREPVEAVKMNPDLLFLRILFTGTIFALLLQPNSASASCRFTSVSDISFASYNVFSSSANTSGVGSLTLKCGNEEHASNEVTLSTGQSNNYATRFMKSGTNRLNYNLYTNVSRTVVWGNGTGGSSVMKADKNTTTLTIYGLIPSGQDAAFGSYQDTITATVEF